MSCWQLPFYSSRFHLSRTVLAMSVVTDAMLKGLAVAMHICMTLLLIAPLDNETKEKWLALKMQLECTFL